MAEVISAQARFAGSGVQGRTAKHVRFMQQAHSLLQRSQGCLAQGETADAFEFAYQAALRAAGARVAVSAVAKRRRLPTSAWERLALVSKADAQWASDFKGYSRSRSRLVSGLDEAPRVEAVYELLELVSRFVDATEAELAFGVEAA